MIHKPSLTKRIRVINGAATVDWRVSLGTHAGKKIILFRQTRAEAKAVGNATYARYSKQGDAAIVLTPEQITDAIAAFRILDGHAITLTELARQHVAQTRKGNTKATFGELMDAYLDGLSADLSATYLRTTRHYAKHFAANVGRETPCAALSPSDLKPVLDEMGGTSAKSYNNTRNALNTVFTWGVNAGMVQTNPVAGIAKKNKIYKEPAFFNAGQVADILNEAAATEDAAPYMPWLVLGFFCGLRSTEIARLRWEDIKWDDSIIRIEKPKGYTHGVKPRFTTLNDTAREWLWPHRREAGTLGDGVGFYRWRDGLQCHPKWSNNAMRHTFATMHYALHNNLALTAAEMGHYENVRTTLEHYRGLATRRDAEAFWALRPPASYGVCREP